MSELINDIKKATQNMTCSLHQKNAVISINGDNISVSACCEEFRDEISKVVEKTTANSIKNQIKNIFK